MFNTKLKMELAEKDKEIQQLNEVIKILDEKLKDRNNEIDDLEKRLILKPETDLLIKELEKLSIKSNKIYYNNFNLVSYILQLFKSLGIKEKGYDIPIIQIYNKELINKIFETIKESEENV